MVGFLDLPDELLIYVLNALRFNDLLKCRQLCKRLDIIIQNETILRYKVELALNGMEDNPTVAMPIIDRFRILKEYHEAWEKLDFKRDYILDMNSDGVWELSCGVLCQARGRRTLVFRQLPSVLRGIKERAWELEDIGVDIRDFSMDPAQDLLVVVETHNASQRIHLRTMCTGEVHPSVFRPAVINYTPNLSTRLYTIKICSDYVGIAFTSTSQITQELAVWNWKTGELRMAVSGHNVSAYSFLTQDHLLLARMSIDAELLVVDLGTASPELTPMEEMEYICSFRLPDVEPGSAIFRAELRADPAPWSLHPTLAAPFQVARDQRVIVLTFTVFHGRFDRSMYFLICGDHLLSHFKTVPAACSKLGIDWIEWGPQASRVLTYVPGYDSVWVCNTYGSSFVNGFRPGFQIYIMDLNQVAIRKLRAERNDVMNESPVPNSSSWVLQDNALVLEHSTFRTSLPIRMRSWALNLGVNETYEAVMISEDCIIFVDLSNVAKTRYRILSM
ncbi:unnamed protein product [Somion occarium]|uniref:F-box domain-containing protein n=1 Tax=Somion occarium TaxID=3059160 RepID=A0ABP1D7K1_9APHY